MMFASTVMMLLLIAAPITATVVEFITEIRQEILPDLFRGLFAL